MCSEFIKTLIILSVIPVCSCSMNRRLSGIADGAAAVGISIPAEKEEATARNDISGIAVAGDAPETGSEGPLIMNAVRDSETGEMVATDVIRASKVTARFRNIAERDGKVTVEFDIEIPPSVIDSRLKLKFTPNMDLMGKVSRLEPLYISGSRYRERQMRGYERYRAFIASIITDSTDFVRIGQLEKFLCRYYPETYSMKTDSSFISVPEAENIFGVTQREALEHYTRHGLIARNEEKRRNSDMMFRKFVKDPFLHDGFRLDTVLNSSDGGVTYRYVQTLKSFPGLRKIIISMDGEIIEDGEKIGRIPSPSPLTFYVSSLSSLVDETPKYRKKILYRTVYDNTRAFIDFGKDSFEVDTALDNNASELRRIRENIRNISSVSGLVLDSMKVSASCSPEGLYSYNAGLAAARAGSVLDYFRDEFPDSLRGRLVSASVPENWSQFSLLVSADTLLSDSAKRKILEIARRDDKDEAERMYSTMQEYRYMRERIYPKLRSVKFEFWLHRKDMDKDTVHTTEQDTMYMRGIESLKMLDYRRAVAILKPYADYNSALACLSAGYVEASLEILSALKPQTAASWYLTAIALSRMDREKDAEDVYGRCIAIDPRMRHRANLDPELSDIARKYEELHNEHEYCN